MRIAYLSPLPPKRTGIATYSTHLLSALREIADIHVVDPTLSLEMLISLNGCDASLYHLGNNPWYHLDIYKVLLRRPGIVVLHDTVLYYLIAGLGLGGMVKEFCLNYGLNRLGEFQQLLASCPDGDVLRYPHPERFPFLRRTLEQAQAIIVHSHTAEKTVRASGYRKLVRVINHLTYPSNDATLEPNELQGLRTGLGLGVHEIVIGCFGFGGATKRPIPLLRAVARLRRSYPLRVLIVGEGHDSRVEKEISRLRIGETVIRLGFVADEDFARYLALTDIVANLRYPSMGEVSGTLIRAFALGKPCVVTNDSWFSELPDTCVWKIRYGEGEVDDLVEALTTLARDPALRRRLGKYAREYAEGRCAPRDIARHYLDVVQQVVQAGDSSLATKGDLAPGEYFALSNHGDDRDWVQRYLLARTLQAIPHVDRIDSGSPSMRRTPPLPVR